MSSLPSGTVTFLFSDVEGSTRLWERDRIAMQAAVERHLALLRTAIETQGGVLYKTVGDGTQAAFPNAAGALSAALAGQRELFSELWPDPPGPLRVRMALHAGEAEPQNGDYLAAPLNRLARLLGIAQGGQILLTETVEQLAQDALPHGASLRDLGEVALRDLDRPERVFALVHEALPRLETTATHGGATRHFPASLTPFLGRETLVATLIELLRDPATRLVTLTGPGGTGKTRLALEAGTRQAASFADGATFVDLVPLQDPTLVLPAIASALGLREAPGRSLEETVHGFLRERELLLVLDNFEHLLEAAPVVADLLAAVPRVKALVTSRASLRVRGEREFPVPPLTLPDAAEPRDRSTLEANEAVAFFVDRARAVRPDFALTDETMAAIAAICVQLDGLPLAIELAAARVKMLPPPALLVRLERRLPLLAAGTRDAPARQRTLRDTIAWSHTLLADDERTLFRRLGVFSGGWTLEAAEHVTDLEGELDVFEGLASLVDKSLVRQIEQADGEARYRMLETIREFALEQLAQSPEDAQALSRRHAAFFAELAIAAENGLSAGVMHDVRSVSADLDNVRAALLSSLDRGDAETALRVAGSMSEYWTFAGGQFAEGRDWLERALRQGQGASAVARAEGFYGVAILALHAGDLETGRGAAEESIALARALGGESFVKAAFMLSTAQSGAGETAAAYALAAEALAVARGVEHPAWLGWALQLMGAEQHIAGELEAAARTLEEALGVFRSFAGRWGEADTLGLLANVNRDRGDLQAAIALYTQTLSVRDEIDAGVGVDNTLIDLADVILALGDETIAARILGAAEAHQDRFGFEPFRTTRMVQARLVADLRARLGAEVYGRLLLEGRILSLPAIVETARTLAMAKS